MGLPTNKGIERVIYDQIESYDGDSRMMLTPILGKDIGNFGWGQVEISEIFRDMELSARSHPYDTLFFLLRGEGTFTLKDMDREIIKKYEMISGNRLLVPKYILYKACFETDSILISLSKKPPIFSKHNDHPYEFPLYISLKKDFLNL